MLVNVKEGGVACILVNPNEGGGALLSLKILLNISY